MKVQPQISSDPQMTTGRTFKNVEQLRDWIQNGDFVHQTQRNGKLNVLLVHHTVPESNEYTPKEYPRTQTQIENELQQDEYRNTPPKEAKQ